MMATGRSEKGFTLLEAMIALAIVALALTTTLALGNRSLRDHGYLQQMSQATLLAQDVLNRVMVTGEVASSGPDEIPFDAPFEAYRWRLEETSTPLPGVRQITVTVVWGDPERNETVELTSFLIEGGR